ncbi:MAG: TPM domain-containing protein, partial [Methyloceanibacter sp.]|uniref:TPM domain-containing protein n=1 Tax=Methyloceanibacter sp. TaxID=1965321 RepID=UPI003EE03F64
MAAITPRSMILRAALLVIALGFAFLPASAEPTFPVLAGRVVDDANLLSPEDEQALTAELKQLEEKSSDQLVVVTLPSL